jgi:hypothetical protein
MLARGPRLMRSRWRRSYLIANLGNTGRTHAIQKRDHVAMQRLLISADRDFHTRIALVELIKRRKNLVVWNELSIDVSGVAGEHLNINNRRVRRLHRRDRRRKSNPDAFHVRLAQAHHHETGEEKEHDIDQRNDLDARSFVRNW